MNQEKRKKREKRKKAKARRLKPRQSTGVKKLRAAHLRDRLQMYLMDYRARPDVANDAPLPSLKEHDAKVAQRLKEFSAFLESVDKSISSRLGVSVEELRKDWKSAGNPSFL